MGPATSATSFQFLEEFVLEPDSLNGLQIENLYIPEEIILNILTYLSPSDILKCSLVCKRWFNIAKSNALWHTIYNEKEYPKKAKHLPWYVFYSYFATDNFKNLIKNGNGQDGFSHWTIIHNGGSKLRVEQIPEGSESLPEGIPEFEGHQSCFATSYEAACKYQAIDLEGKHLLKYIIKKYKPSLYASEWCAGRFDCACFYQLSIICNTNTFQWKPRIVSNIGHRSARSIVEPFPEAYSFSNQKIIEQWAGKTWEKVHIQTNSYPDDIEKVFFYHEGRDLQFWSGHYGSKMAGGVLKFDFDSIIPTDEDDDDVIDDEEEMNN